MECIKIEALSFSYPNRAEALSSVSLTVERGAFVLLCGASGCGKTTLLRLLKPSLTPHGSMDGAVFFDGKPLSEYTLREQTERIGFVMQNPDRQIVTDKVWHELAFGLESLGCPQNEIRARVSEMASFFGIQTWFHKNVSELSGGQKQLLNLAAVMVMQPSLLLLDEPTSQLDPIAASEFLHTLSKINRELGTTVILTEHRLEDAFPIADRVVVMDGGKVIANAVPNEVGALLRRTNHEMYHALPTPVRVHGAVETPLPCPITVREGRAWLEAYAKENPLNPNAIPKDAPQSTADVVIDLQDIWFRYEKDSPDVIRGLSLTALRGEILSLLGGNGSGKTTALSLMAGLLRPHRGRVTAHADTLAYLPQDPQSVFVKNTVFLDLKERLRDEALSQTEADARIRTVAELCNIEGLLSRHPYDLSGGEQQRAALAKILLADPTLLFLDEPTKGMDAAFKTEFAEILHSLKARGVTVVMVSHDIEFCAEYSDRCALMFDGTVTATDTPRKFFSGKNFYTTAANRMARSLLPDAVLPNDIIRACGGKIPPRPPRTRASEEKTPQKQQEIPKKPCEKTKKTAVFASVFLLFSIPLTLAVGHFCFGERKFYLTALLILLQTMIPFFLLFESRKPKARELIVISVLCALAVAGRAAFYMLPQCKPTLAIVIIAGACFGGETGFLVGAVTAFVSNFFFGQGPWLPWQMFAFGIIGFLAGCLPTRCKSKRGLCIFGALSVFFLYGGILNPASVLMWQTDITWEMIVSACVAGLPFDLIHSVSTAVFLYLFATPMTKKLERVKLKYGLL